MEPDFNKFFDDLEKMDKENPNWRKSFRDDNYCDNCQCHRCSDERRRRKMAMRVAGGM